MTENDLISRSALRRHIIAFATGCHAAYLTIENIVMMINQADTADAVEVVRCKECQAYSKNPWSDSGEMVCKCWCSWIPTDPDDFCSYGERRTDE